MKPILGFDTPILGEPVPFILLDPAFGRGFYCKDWAVAGSLSPKGKLATCQNFRVATDKEIEAEPAFSDYNRVLLYDVHASIRDFDALIQQIAYSS